MDSNSSDQDRSRVADWFSADRPIAARGDDKLGRRGFAEALADALSSWRGKDSLVIALYGPWGTGKSSLKNMAVEDLSEKRTPKPLVVEFNPWRFANRDQLTESFFDQIGIALGKGSIGSKKDRKHLLNRWRRYAGYFRAAGGLMGVVRKSVASILFFASLMLLGTSVFDARILTGISGLLLLVAGLLVTWSAEVSEAVVRFLAVGVEIGAQTLEDVKGELGMLLRRLQSPLVVVMDDVDRLTPVEVLKIVQLVKANADFPNMIYLILCERSTVEKSVGQVLQADGRQYLEKIVQVGFDIPVIEKPRVDKILFEGLDRLLAEEPVGRRFDQQRWGNLFIGGLQPYFSTLRDVNRFLSTLALHIGLFKSEASFEVNPIDLIGLEVLRVFEPEVYRGIAANKTLLVPLLEPAAHEVDGRKKTLQEILAFARESTRARVEGIVKQLFPPIEKLLGGSGYSAEFQEIWFRDLRVCAHAAFDRYFHLTIPEGDVSQATLDRILGSAGDRERLRSELKQLAERNLLGTALERLEAYKETIPLDHASPFITALFDISEALPEEPGGIFGISPTMHAVRIIYWCLRREENHTTRAQILSAAIQQTDGISLPVDLVAIQQQAMEKPDRDDRLIDDQDLEKLKQLCLAKIRAWARENQLPTARDLISVLYRWKDWGTLEEVREFCGNLVSTQQGAITLTKAFVQRSTSHGFGDHVGREHWYIGLGNLETFVAWEIIEQALKGLNEETLSNDDRRAVSAFRRAVDRRRAGKPDSRGLRDRFED